ncbi:MAG: hypothetical protein JNK05_32515 [Myxococcales bacterium]|nr:hypothetical protein [Myxococcales bacterium]
MRPNSLLSLSLFALVACGSPVVSEDTGVRNDASNNDATTGGDSNTIDSSSNDVVTMSDVASADTPTPVDSAVSDVPSADVPVANDGSTMDCPGRPSSCVSGTPGGVCGDALVPPMCIAGSWTCPRGTIPVTECGCVGRPPGPDCACVARMWMCPMADAGSRSFACGTTSCTSGAQYCQVTIPGLPSGMRTYSCAALPSSCAPTPSCRCIPLAGGSTCMQSSAGDITVTTALP